MMLQKTFKYRLEPTNIQKDKLAQFAGSVRFVYNHGLALIKQALKDLEQALKAFWRRRAKKDTTSQGVKIANPRYLKHDLVRLRHQQRLLSGKVKGSKNRKKQVQRVVALHQKIKNKRKDFTHKQSTQFVKNHDVVAVENLHFVSIDRFKPTSQICSSCGNRQPMPLSNRIFNCQDCGLEQDRDINASLNIRSAGLAVLNACGGHDSGQPSEAGISSF